MAEPRATLTGALDAARQGLNQAQEQARQAGSRRALLGATDAPPERTAGASPQGDAAQDMVQLSQSLGQAKINASSIHIVSGVSEEVIALGRRIDVSY